MVQSILSKFSTLFLILALHAAGTTLAFTGPMVPASSSANKVMTPTPTTRTESSASSRLHLFNKLGDAFKNDDSLGQRQNAGLTGGPKFNENVTVNGKAVPGAVAGQKLTAVANKVRVKIPVNCQQGDCGTCMVKMNGRKVKACQTPLPSGKATIETL